MKQELQCGGALGIVLLIALAFLLATPWAGVGEPTGGPLRVFVPWCMEKRLRRIVEAFQEQRPTTPVRFTTGTPGQLLAKIKEGGRPDVYIAMGPAEVEVLNSLGLVVPGSAREILMQTLVLAVSSEARESVKELRDLAKKEVAAVGIGQPTLESGRLTRAALRKLGILEAVEPKARTSPLRCLVLGDVQAAVLYEQCVYDEDLHAGVLVTQRGIGSAWPLPKELCEPFPVVAVALKPGHPAAATFIQVLTEKRAQDILHRRGAWSCPICEMKQ